MYLGIHIGGTKTQLGVATAAGEELLALERSPVDASRGATGILEEIARVAPGLIERQGVERIGIGFAGAVDVRGGKTVKSRQVPGWENLPLVDWCRRTLQRPAALAGGCDLAALAEARQGAGLGKSVVLYVGVGSGVAGGLVIDGKPVGIGRPAVCEIGQLRPSLLSERPEQTVEVIAGGLGIAEAAQSRLTGDISRPVISMRAADGAEDSGDIQQRLRDAEQADEEFAADLLQRCDHEPELLTAKIVAQAAADGNQIAIDVLQHARHTLGWAIAQAITLTAPEVVVIGGGVSRIGEPLFFAPLRETVARYTFPPLNGSYAIVPASLGEMGVVHGAIALAEEM